MVMRNERVWGGWIILICILALGAWIHLSGYNAGIVISDFDENRIYLDMLYRLEGDTALDKLTLVGYPPFVFHLYELAHRITLEPNAPLLTPHPRQTIGLLKLWAGGANLLTAFFLAMSGRMLSGWRTGLSVALIWLVMPTIIERTVLGLTEAWQVCLITGALCFMILAVRDNVRWAAIMCTILAVIVFFFKYSAFPIFGLGLAATLWHLWRHPRRWSGAFLIQIVLIGLSGLVVAHSLASNSGIISAEGSEGSRFLSGNLFANLLDLPLQNLVWSSAAAQITMRPYALLLIASLGLSGIAFWLTLTAWKRFVLLIIAGLGCVLLLLIPAYMTMHAGVQRYTTPASSTWVLLIVTSMGWVSHWLLRHVGKRIGQSVFAALFLIWCLPAFQRSALHAALASETSALYEYVRWTEATLPNDGALLIRFEDWWLFGDTYWDYHVSRIWVQGDITEIPRSEWLDKGILYTSVTQTQLTALEGTPQGRQDLANMHRLKKVSGSGGRYEPLFVYYLPTLQSPADGPATFDNGLSLIGCRITDASEDPARRLRVQCLWQAATPQTRSWKFYVHLVPPDSRVPVAQADGFLTLATRPPETWNDAEEILVGPPYTIDIPDNVDIGTIRMLVGLYDEATGSRVLQNNVDYIELPMPIDLTFLP